MLAEAIPWQHESRAFRNPTYYPSDLFSNTIKQTPGPRTKSKQDTPTQSPINGIEPRALQVMFNSIFQSLTPTWFVLSDTTFRPDDAIQVGQLIIDPLIPYQRLGDGPLEYQSRDVVDTDTSVGPFKYESTHMSGTDTNISALFFNILSLGFHGGGNDDRGTTYDVQKFTATTFKPSADYVDRSVLQESVVNHLQSKKSPLYMIVGVRIAHGATVSYTHSRGRNAGVNAGPFGLAGGGSPVDANIRVSHNTSRTLSQTLTIEKDFVFAYRLRKCNYSRSTQTLRPTFYTKGAAMHNSESRRINRDENEDSNSVEMSIILSEGIREVDPNAKDLRPRKEWVHSSSDNGGCDCILLALAKEQRKG